MRTKRFIIIGLALAVVVLVVVIATSKIGKKQAELNVCPQFLAAIQANKPADAYLLLSKNAQTHQAENQWKTTVSGLVKAYGTVKPIALKNNTAISNKKGAILPSDATEAYQYNSMGISYIATCYLKLNDGAYQVDGFNSYIQQGQL